MSRTATLAFVGGLLISLPALAGTVDVVKGQASSLPASAATVKDITGQVWINHGKGFKPVVTTTQANVGDQVMARPGGHARIVYAEGCTVDVYPGAVAGVAGSCKVAMAKPMTAGLEPVVAAPAALGWPWWLAGGALAVGTACIGFCGDNGGNGGNNHKGGNNGGSRD